MDRKTIAGGVVAAFVAIGAVNAFAAKPKVYHQFLANSSFL